MHKKEGEPSGSPLYISPLLKQDPRSECNLRYYKKTRFNAGASHGTAFSLCVIALLFVELFSPLTFAQETPSGPITNPVSPSSGIQQGSGDCYSNSLTPSQTKAFWDATFGFIGQEINALAYNQLLQNKAGAIAQQPQNLTVNVDTDSGKMYSVSDVAQVMGRDPEAVAEDLNAEANGTIDLATVKAYMAAKPGPAGALERLLGIRPKLEIEKPAFDNYKIKLPNQREISLREVFSMQEIGQGTDKCLLDHSDIKGKVSYISLLGKDLFIGFDQSSTTVNANQHLTSTNTLAALSLNGGSDVIIPLRYLNFMKFVQGVLAIDTYATLIETGIAFVSQKAVKQGMDNVDFFNKQADNYVPDNAAMIRVFDQNTPQIRTGFDLQTLREPTSGSLEALRDSLERRGGLAPERAEFFTGILDDLPQDAAEQRAELTRRLSNSEVEINQLFEIDSSLQVQVGRARLRNDYLDKAVDIGGDDNLRKICGGPCGPKELEKAQRVYQLLADRALNNFAFGMLWLGPGRLALSASNAMTFSSNDKRFADNYLQVYINKGVGLDFKKASNFMLSGKVIEIVSQVTKSGVPKQIFETGQEIMVNQPDVETSEEEGKASLTSMKSDVDRWSIATYWKGRSSSTLFEDIRNRNDYARMSMFANNMTLGANLERKNEFSDYYEIMAYAAPLLAWQIMKFPDAPFVTLSRIAVMDFYVNNLVDPNIMKPDEVCKDEIVKKWMTWYAVMTGAGQVQNILMLPEAQLWVKTKSAWLTSHAGDGIFASVLAKSKSMSSLRSKLKTAMDIVAPAEMGKMWAASMGFQYTMNCKDTSYEILAIQPLDQKPKGGVSALKEKLNPIGVDKLVGNLSIGSALQGVGQNIDKESQTEIINLRTLMQDQQGMVTPTKLYYLHLDGATQEWWGVFEQLENKGCFRKCIDGNYTAICMTENGVELINKVTGERTKLADKDHALMSQLDPATGSAMIPNTLVSAKMNCAPQQTILQVKSDSHLYAGSGCSSIDCLISELSRLTGTAVGSDLSQPLGKVKALHTDRGLVTVENGVIRFVRTAGTESEYKGIGLGAGRNETEVMEEDETTTALTNKKSLVGTETRIPSLDAERGVDGGSVQGNIYSPSSIDIRGDGSVVASGFISASQGSSEMGQFISMTLEKGKIEYDRQGQRILVALYVLGEVNAPESIKSINVAAAKNVDENGKETPAIRIDNVQAKPGQEEFADSFNKGLQQVQGAGGMQMLDTADKTYYFTTDAAGNPVLRVLDKKTGKYSDYKITGQITSDGKTVSVPTDKGPFAFNFSMNDKGQPTLTVNGPDGYKDIATLLAARGQNGIIIFDPATGSFRAFNGQDMSLNRDFATKGLTYVGSPEGVRGVPTDNFLDYRRQGTGDSTGGPNLLAMPLFPENALLAGAMLLAIVVGVVAIRVHSMPLARAKSRKKR